MVFKKSVILPTVSNAFLYVLIALATLAPKAHGQKNPYDLKNSKAFIDEVKHYLYLDPDSALLFVKAGLEKAIEDQDLLGQAALLNQYGMIDDNAARYRESKQKYLQAEAIYRKEKNDEGIASTLIRLGVVEKRQGNFDKALAYYIQTLDISETNGNKLGMLEARVVLSEVYFSLDDFENSLKNLQIAEKLNDKLPTSNLSLHMYISYGNFFIKINRFDKAISYIETGLSKCDRVEYNGAKIGLLKLRGDAYNKIGDKIKAISSYKQALAFAREIKNVLREQNVLIDLAQTYVKQEPNAALKYLKEALDIVGRHKMYRQEIIILNNMAEVYKRKGDFSTALSLNEKSYKLSEEVYYKEMTKQISNLETAYELEKSNAELGDLQLKSNKEKTIRNIVLFIALAISATLIVTLVYYYRANHLNKLLQQANDKLAESNDQKDQFFSIVAHDIRSPLASAIGV